MSYKKYILPLFILVALIQLVIPLKMILNEEAVISEGTLFKFKVAPVDPNDPFRGKYIALRYQETIFQVEDGKDWNSNQQVYVILTTDTDGFMKIKDVKKEKPSHTPDYVKAKITYIIGNQINLAYPFDRYYMEESKAYDAEHIYNNSLRDTIKHETYALIYVKEAKSVLQDVLIDGIPIKEHVLNTREVEPLKIDQ